MPAKRRGNAKERPESKGYTLNRMRTVVIACGAVLAGIFSTTSAQALDTSGYSFNSASGQCVMDISFYYNNGWYQEYNLYNNAESGSSCTAWFYTTDKGDVGTTTAKPLHHSSYSTSDSPTVYVTPYVKDYAGTTNGSSR